MTPSCLPSTPMTRTSRARIFPLTLTNEEEGEAERGAKGRLKTPSPVELYSCSIFGTIQALWPLSLSKRQINLPIKNASKNNRDFGGWEWGICPCGFTPDSGEQSLEPLLGFSQLGQSRLELRPRKIAFAQDSVAVSSEAFIKRDSKFHDDAIAWFGCEHGEQHVLGFAEVAGAFIVLHKTALHFERERRILQSGEELFDFRNELRTLKDIAARQSFEQQVQSLDITRAPFLDSVLSSRDIASLTQQRCHDQSLLADCLGRLALNDAAKQFGFGHFGHPFGAGADEPLEFRVQRAGRFLPQVSFFERADASQCPSELLDHSDDVVASHHREVRDWAPPRDDTRPT